MIQARNIDFTTMKRWVPDYSNMSSTNLASQSDTFTIADTGFMQFKLNAWSQSPVQLTLSINGKTIFDETFEPRTSNSLCQGTISGVIPVTNGDVVSFSKSGSWNNHEAHFIPGKWV